MGESKAKKEEKVKGKGKKTQEILDLNLYYFYCCYA